MCSIVVEVQRSSSPWKTNAHLARKRKIEPSRRLERLNHCSDRPFWIIAMLDVMAGNDRVHLPFELFDRGGELFRRND